MALPQPGRAVRLGKQDSQGRGRCKAHWNREQQHPLARPHMHCSEACQSLSPPLGLLSQILQRKLPVALSVRPAQQPAQQAAARSWVWAGRQGVMRRRRSRSCSPRRRPVTSSAATRRALCCTATSAAATATCCRQKKGKPQPSSSLDFRTIYPQEQVARPCIADRLTCLSMWPFHS